MSRNLRTVCLLGFMGSGKSSVGKCLADMLGASFADLDELVAEREGRSIPDLFRDGEEAFRKAGPKIMEPIYNVEVLTPSEYMGACMSDMQNRRAIIEGMGTTKGFDVLKARVPLAELYKYSTTLSSLTSGAATFTMNFADYQPVPADVQEKLLKAYMESEKDE